MGRAPTRRRAGSSRPGTEAHHQRPAEYDEPHAEGHGGVHVFISSAERDRHLAVDVATKLKAKGISYYSYLHEDPPGERFADRVRLELERASHVLVVGTPTSLRTSWVMIELGAAWMRGKHIVPVVTNAEQRGQLEDPLRRFRAISIAEKDDLVAMLRHPAPDARRVITWEAVRAHVEKIRRDIERASWRPDVLLAYPKGGLIVADLLGHEYNSQLEVVSIFTSRTRVGGKIDFIIRESFADLRLLGRNKGKILIVDDVLENGQTMRKVIELLVEKYEVKESRIKTAVLGRAVAGPPVLEPDFYAFNYVTSRGLEFPWGPVTL